MTVAQEETEIQPAGEDTQNDIPVPEPEYQSLQLVEGLPLSAVVGACWPLQDPKVLLKQNWAAPPGEEAPDAAPPPAFDPTSASYSLIPARLSKCKALLEVNRLKIAMADKQQQISGLDKTEEAKKEAMTAELEELKAKSDEAAAAFSEAKASFAEDATSLAPWMNSLFALVDMGVTTFTASGSFWPHCSLASAFTPRDGAELTEGVEKMLAAFKKRCEFERGAGAIQVVLRMAPNIFRDGFSAEAVNAAVTRLLQSQGIDPEAGGAASLDAVELVWCAMMMMQLRRVVLSQSVSPSNWWDSASRSAVATLQQLAKLCVNETETDPDSGEVTITAPRKIKALGVYNFSAKDLLAAIAAGVTISFVHCRYGLHCAAEAADVLRLCKEYGIKVLGDEGTMYGLIDESFLGVPCPSIMDSSPLLHSAADALALVTEYGGWDKVQTLLAAVKKVADRRGVKMQAVALRWQMDHGVVPTVPTSWGPDSGAAFGYYGTTSGATVDAGLFHSNSFLDAEDMSILNALAH